MIRFGATQKNGRALVGLGLEEEHLVRLKAGKPIALKLDEIVPGLVGDLLIFYGKDRHAMLDDLAVLIKPDTIFPTVTPAERVF